MTRKDWLLLVVVGREGTEAKPIDALRAMKVLFVFSRQLGPKLETPGFYAYEPTGYGPFAREINADLDQLEYEGLIEPVSNPGRSWPRYRATQLGVDTVAALDGADGRIANYLLDVRDWAMSIMFWDLLRSVHQRWPEYATRDVAGV